MKNIVELLKEKNKTISTMESCTGGAIANYITNIPDSSMVFSYGAITYSNEFKVKMGVSPDVIQKYTVYSMETARCMAKTICEFTNSNFGVGVTGKLKKTDPFNLDGEDDICYLSIYDKDNNKYYNQKIKVINDKREDNKNQIVNGFLKQMVDILKEKR